MISRRRRVLRCLLMRRWRVDNWLVWDFSTIYTYVFLLVVSVECSVSCTVTMGTLCALAWDATSGGLFSERSRESEADCRVLSPVDVCVVVLVQCHVSWSVDVCTLDLYTLARDTTSGGLFSERESMADCRALSPNCFSNRPNCDFYLLFRFSELLIQSVACRELFL